MEQYKKTVEGQHAPEALIAKTLQRIHEEEQHTAQEAVIQENNKKTRSKLWYAVPMGMVAGLALVVGVMNGQSGLTYHSIEGSVIRDVDDAGMRIETEIDINDYEEYLGVDLEGVSESIILTEADAWVSYDEMKTEIVADEGTFYYDIDSNRVMVKVSKTIEVAPEELRSVEASEWNELVIYAGENASQNQYMAAVERDGIRYFVMGYDMPEREFENFLKKFF